MKPSTRVSLVGLGALKRFVWLTLFADVGLILWELGQRSSRGLFFDPEDIVATLVGLGVGWSVFAVVRDKTG